MKSQLYNVPQSNIKLKTWDDSALVTLRRAPITFVDAVELAFYELAIYDKLMKQLGLPSSGD